MGRLMTRLADVTADYLNGADRGRRRRRCSSSTRGWARSSPADYRTYVLPHMPARHAARCGRACRSIHFGIGTGGLLAAACERRAAT